MDSLTFTPPPGSAGMFTLLVTAIATDRLGGLVESTPAALPIHVIAAADTPAWIEASAGPSSASIIPLHLSAASPDDDGSEVLSYLVAELRDGVGLTAGVFRGDGVWALSADEAGRVGIVTPAGFAATLDLAITAIAVEADGGPAARTTTALTIVVTGPGDREASPTATPDAAAGPVAETPDLDVAAAPGVGHGGVPTDNAWIALDIAARLTDSDGAERLGVVVREVPEGFALSAGSAGGDRVWLIDPADLDGLAIRPPAGYAGSLTLLVEAIAVEATGEQARQTARLPIEIATSSPTRPPEGPTPTVAEPEPRQPARHKAARA